MMTHSRRWFLRSLTVAAAELLLIPRPRTRVGVDGAKLQLAFFADANGASKPASSAAMGATIGAEEAAHAARLFGLTVELAIGRSASQLLAGHPSVLIGGFDRAECDSLARLAEESNALFFNVGCGSDELRGIGCDRHAFHITASDAMRRDALTSFGDAQVVLWHESLERFGAGQLNARFRNRFSVGMDSAAWAGWIAAKIAAEAFFRRSNTAADALRAELERPAARFDGHKGRPLSFRSWDHQLRQPLYLMQSVDGTTTLSEVPAGPQYEGNAAEQLDQLGTSRTASACDWGSR